MNGERFLEARGNFLTFLSKLVCRINGNYGMIVSSALFRTPERPCLVLHLLLLMPHR